jgi:hypothetical protein
MGEDPMPDGTLHEYVPRQQPEQWSAWKGLAFPLLLIGLIVICSILIVASWLPHGWTAKPKIPSYPRAAILPTPARVLRFGR